MDFFYKWLPIFFGCHTKGERSFYYRGRKFPICARCTGELIGIIISFIAMFFLKFNNTINILFLVPMIIDGFLQLLTKYESNNIKRLITGILFGFALSNLFLESVRFVWILGYNYGRQIRT